MTDEKVTNEMLMAYVDNELDQADARLIEEVAARDTGVAQRLERQRSMRAAVKAAYGGIVDEPVPQELEERVRAMVAKSKDNVVPLRARTTSPRTRSAAWALAASVAAIAIGIGGYLVGSLGGRSGDTVALGAVTAPALASALSTAPSGESHALGSGALVKPVTSFRDAEGRLCREFEIAPRVGARTLGVACRAGSEWRVDFAMASGGEGEGYAPASSTETLDAFLHAISASAPLSAEEERAALRQ